MTAMISSSKVLSRLSVNSDAGVEAAVKSAIAGAQARMASLLGFKLEAGSAEDVFFIDSIKHVEVDGLYTLKPRFGLIKNASVVITYGDSLESVQSTAPNTLTTFLVTTDGSYIRIPVSLRDTYVKVAYDHGFNGPSEVPDWLEEVMISYTIKVLSMQQVSDGKPVLSNTFPFLDAHIRDTLSGHLRTRSEAIPALA